jgi:hypothetical protein
MGRFARVVYPERRGTRRAISNDGYITILIERYFKLPCVSSACQILPARLHSVELAIGFRGFHSQVFVERLHMLSGSLQDAPWLI